MYSICSVHAASFGNGPNAISPWFVNRRKKNAKLSIWLLLSYPATQPDERGQHGGRHRGLGLDGTGLDHRLDGRLDHVGAHAERPTAEVADVDQAMGRSRDIALLPDRRAAR